MDDNCSVISMNFEGCLLGSEMKTCGQKVINNLLLENNVTIFFGQKASFKIELPANYQYIGGKKTFIFYDKIQLVAVGDKHYKEYIKTLESDGKIQKNNLPESNYTISKIRTRGESPLEFIAVSWVTDNHMGLQCSTIFRSLCYFLNSLSIVEGIPILLSGSFHIDYNKASELIPSNFRCQNYKLSSKRMAMRFSNLFVNSCPLHIDKVVPLNAGKITLDHNKDRQQNIIAEDAFYFDAISGSVVMDSHFNKSFITDHPVKKQCKLRKTSSLPVYKFNVGSIEDEKDKDIIQATDNNHSDGDMHKNLLKHKCCKPRQRCISANQNKTVSKYTRLSKLKGDLFFKTVSLPDLRSLNSDHKTGPIRVHDLSGTTGSTHLVRLLSGNNAQSSNSVQITCSLDEIDKLSKNPRAHPLISEALFEKENNNVMKSYQTIDSSDGGAHSNLSRRKTDFNIPEFLNEYAPVQRQEDINVGQTEVTSQTSPPKSSKLEMISNIITSACGLAP